MTGETVLRLRDLDLAVRAELDGAGAPPAEARL